jgi:hypothetical protein
VQTSTDHLSANVARHCLSRPESGARREICKRSGVGSGPRCAKRSSVAESSRCWGVTPPLGDSPYGETGLRAPVAQRVNRAEGDLRVQRAGAQVTRNRSQRGVRLTAAVAAAACVLAACSASDDASLSSTSLVSEPSSSEVVEEPETTSSTSSTTTPNTTTSTIIPLPVVDTVPSSVDSEPQSDTTIAPDPPPVPTNTLFDPTTPSGEVEQATVSNLIAFSDCLAQLPNCDPQAATRFAALEHAADNISAIEGWNENGLEIRDVDSWVFVVEGVEFSDDGIEAIASTCSFDGSQLVVPATDTSAEEIFDAGNVSSRSKYLVARIGEAWVVTARESVERIDGSVEGYCG